MNKIGLASDHAGFELKTFVKQYLDEHNIEYVDYGTDSEASCDYPDYAHALAAGLAMASALVASQCAAVAKVSP